MADPAHKLSPPYALNKPVLDVLRTVMDLPKSIIALTLTLATDRVPVVECKFHPLESGVEISEPVTKRFGLHELP